MINFVLMTQCVLFRTAFKYYLNEDQRVKCYHNRHHHHHLVLSESESL